MRALAASAAFASAVAKEILKWLTRALFAYAAALRQLRGLGSSSQR
jgi:hypothetical protein